MKLWLAGIKVLTGEEWIKEPGYPYLYVNVNIMKLESDLYVYSIGVELDQRVFLSRSPKIFVGARTWRKGLVGIVGAQKMVDDIRNTVKEIMDMFINDYLSVNPK